MFVREKSICVLAWISFIFIFSVILAPIGLILGLYLFARCLKISRQTEPKTTIDIKNIRHVKLISSVACCMLFVQFILYAFIFKPWVIGLGCDAKLKETISSIEAEKAETQKKINRLEDEHKLYLLKMQIEGLKNRIQNKTGNKADLIREFNIKKDQADGIEKRLANQS